MSKPIARTAGSRPSAWRKVPETQRPSSSTWAPSERGNSSYQELNRARSRRTCSRTGSEGDTSSRSGLSVSARRTWGLSPDSSRSGTVMSVSRIAAAAKARLRAGFFRGEVSAIALSRTWAPSSSISSTSTPAAILIVASCSQVPYGSLQPSTR
jgi:hypothetical protein